MNEKAGAGMHRPFRRFSWEEVYSFTAPVIDDT